MHEWIPEVSGAREALVAPIEPSVLRRIDGRLASLFITGGLNRQKYQQIDVELRSLPARVEGVLLVVNSLSGDHGGLWRAVERIRKCGRLVYCFAHDAVGPAFVLGAATKGFIASPRARVGLGETGYINFPPGEGPSNWPSCEATLRAFEQATRTLRPQMEISPRGVHNAEQAEAGQLVDAIRRTPAFFVDHFNSPAERT